MMVSSMHITSIILMILTLFEQVPMSNVAYYKADTDLALEEIQEVIVPKYKIPSEHTNLKRSQNLLLEIKMSHLNMNINIIHFKTD